MSVHFVLHKLPIVLSKMLHQNVGFALILFKNVLISDAFRVHSQQDSALGVLSSPNRLFYFGPSPSPSAVMAVTIGFLDPQDYLIYLSCRSSEQIPCSTDSYDQ